MATGYYWLVKWRREGFTSEKHVVVQTHHNEEQRTACGLTYQYGDVVYTEQAPLNPNDDDTCLNCVNAVQSTPGA